jgi:hypothetical protein
MAKSITKSAKAPARKAKTTVAPIAKVTQTILEKLKALNIEQQLQSDIAWCLGSYSYDNNPIGLYEVATKALVILKIENAKKTKGITAKMITDIEKTLTTK